MGYLRINGLDPVCCDIDDISDVIDDINDDVTVLYTDNAHDSYIFPEDTDETVIWTAGNVNHTWSAWAEIVDNNAVTLSSKVAATGMHISAILIEDVDTTGKTYMYEIAYGASHTVVARARFAASDANKGNPIQEARIRADHIPTGETVYYRMKCETASATAQISVRYHDPQA